MKVKCVIVKEISKMQLCEISVVAFKTPVD